MNTLNSGQQLSPGQSIASNNGHFTFSLQTDGNLVLYRGPTALWNTGTNGKPVQVAAMQADGNLVLYDGQGHPLWASGTNGHPGAFLVVQDDGNVVIYAGTTPIWATNTNILNLNTGWLTSGLALGGFATTVMQQNGDYDFISHAHDSGFDNIDYTISAVLVTPDAFAFTFQHSGSVEGTIAGLPFGKPNRNDDWIAPAANNPLIAGHWAGILQGKLMARIDGTDTTVKGIEGVLGDLLKQLLGELGQAAAKAIIALI